MSFFIKKIGIDLGTANTLVFVPGKGVVINEPSVVAVSVAENKVLAVGNEAKEMLGRTPDTIVASQPLRDGAIADYRVTEAMLRYFIQKVSGRFRFFRPEVVLSIPAGITSTERRAVIDAALKAGARAAFVVKEPVLAAIGAGIPIHAAQGNMIINIGGGTSEIAVISLGGIVASASARVGGNKIDLAISDFIKRKYSLAIGERTAEEVKIKIGAAIAQVKEDHMEVRGRDLMGGLPKTVTLSSNEVTEAIQDELREIINVVKQVLQETPPELAADIMDKGIVLTGGGSLLRNLDKRLREETGLPITIAEEPLSSVALGTGAMLADVDLLRKISID